MRDAAAGDSGFAAAPSAAMQRAAELTQRRINLEQKLRDIDHMVRCSDAELCKGLIYACSMWSWWQRAVPNVCLSSDHAVRRMDSS